MNNPKYIQSTDPQQIASELFAFASQGAHFTNGTYAKKAALVVPTTLAGFKKVTETQPDLPLVIAVNSDKSMQLHDLGVFEEQSIRAAKVAEPLAKLFPQNKVIVVYYDEKTPEKLYEALHQKEITITLHKWGYGTKPGEPMIVGAECFTTTYGFPMPNDEKPVCYSNTPVSTQQQKITVADLRDTLISANGVLFPLPAELQQHRAMLRYNVVLLPVDSESKQILFNLTERVIKQFDTDNVRYKLTEGSSLPHVSVFQLQIAEDQKSDLNNVLQIMKAAWQQVITSDDDCRLTPEATLHAKHDAEGEFKNTTWVELTFAKQKNPMLQKFHAEVFAKLSSCNLQCLNAHGFLYRPHLTLFNFTEEFSSEKQEVKISTQEKSLLDGIIVHPAVGEANKEWEVIALAELSPENSPPKVEQSKKNDVGW